MFLLIPTEQLITAYGRSTVFGSVPSLIKVIIICKQLASLWRRDGSQDSSTDLIETTWNVHAGFESRPVSDSVCLNITRFSFLYKSQRWAHSHELLLLSLFSICEYFDMKYKFLRCQDSSLQITNTFFCESISLKSRYSANGIVWRQYYRILGDIIISNNGTDTVPVALP